MRLRRGAASGKVSRNSWCKETPATQNQDTRLQIQCLTQLNHLCADHLGKNGVNGYLSIMLFEASREHPYSDRLGAMNSNT